MTSSRPFTEVAAGVCLREDGSYLVARRPAGKVYAGYWEFPGGKLEPGEAAGDALVRELQEELGITPLEFHPWITRTHYYEHANVRLRFFRIRRWRGDFICREFQQIAWQRPGQPGAEPMLPANGPILRALALPARMGISQATGMGEAVFRDRLARALKGGMRAVMVREKTWGEDTLVAFARGLVQACRDVGAISILNASPQAALAAGVDGVHLSAARLMGLKARPDLTWCGASCHDAAEMQRAVDLGLDYVALGSVLPTPSHPGQSVLGWPTFAQLVRDYPLPVYALGGMSPSLERTAWEHGAHGIAMMRAAWAAHG